MDLVLIAVIIITLIITITFIIIVVVRKNTKSTPGVSQNLVTQSTLPNSTTPAVKSSVIDTPVTTPIIAIPAPSSGTTIINTVTPVVPVTPVVTITPTPVVIITPTPVIQTLRIPLLKQNIIKNYLRKTLKSNNTGYCLSTANNLQDDSNIYMAKCNNTQMQKWTYDATSKTIVNIVNNKCMYADAITKNIMQSDCTSDINQQWSMSDNNKFISGIDGNMCLSTDNTNPTMLQLAPCSNTTNNSFQWSLF